MHVLFASTDCATVHTENGWADFTVDLATPLYLYSKSQFECALVELSITESPGETTPTPIKKTVLHVFCDLVEPSQVAGVSKPVLRRVYMRQMLKTGALTYDLPQYRETSGGRVESFRVYIRAEDGTTPSLSDVVTRGALHLRPTR